MTSACNEVSVVMVCVFAELLKKYQSRDMFTRGHIRDLAMLVAAPLDAVGLDERNAAIAALCETFFSEDR